MQMYNQYCEKQTAIMFVLKTFYSLSTNLVYFGRRLELSGPIQKA